MKYIIVQIKDTFEPSKMYTMNRGSEGQLRLMGLPKGVKTHSVSGPLNMFLLSITCKTKHLSPKCCTIAWPTSLELWI